MKLYAEVEVVNRNLACHGHKGLGKKVKSHLAIGKKPLDGGKSEVFLMLTNAQNKQGSKYLLPRNVDQVFTRLVNEGKTTIRIKEPSHDLVIKGDPIEVKGFLSVLKKVLSGQGIEKLTLSSLQPLSNKQLSGPKKKLTVGKRSEYPVKDGFPQTLTCIKIGGIRLAKIDSRIMNLVNLVELDMSNNEIEIIPENFDSLHSLRELNLSGNKLATLSRGFCTGKMTQTLKLLNVSGNQIKLLPIQICQLSRLVTLNLDLNQLPVLPPSIGKLSQLKHFSASGNLIKILPGSFASLRLDSLELSGNPIAEPETKVISNKLEAVSSLLEITARNIVKNKIKVSPDDIFPRLMAYLDSCMFCPCKEPVWNNCARALVKLQLGRVSHSVSCEGLAEVAMDASLCSVKCLTLFQNNPFAF